jgi:dTDP-4-dehydrorhamnose reductase
LTTLILGSNGFLGKEMSSYLKQNNSKKESLILNESKFNKLSQLKKLLQDSKPKVIINCIAMTDSRKCETFPKKAIQVNSEIPELISQYSSQHDSTFIHISSDAVMDLSSAFKCENEIPKPFNVYGMSKLIGENAIVSSNCDFLICRVNFFGNSHKKNSLLDFFVTNIQSNSRCPGYINVWFNPLGIQTIIESIFKLFRSNARGVFHVAGDSKISKYEFGKEIERLINPISNLVYPTNVLSSMIDGKGMDLSLCNCKLKRYIKRLPSWQTDLESVLSERVMI